MERLDKLLAATGQWSRKEAKALVKAGRVQVGGARPKGPEDKVAEGTPVTVDGRPIATEQGVYVMLHKPAGVVSSTQDPRERTVLDLLPQHLRRRRCFPWGGWTRTPRGCSCSPMTDLWPTPFWRRGGMWTRSTMWRWTAGWTSRTGGPFRRE